MKIKTTDYITGEPLVLNSDSTLDVIRVRNIGKIVHSKNRYIIGQAINDAVFNNESQNYTVEIQFFANDA